MRSGSDSRKMGWRALLADLLDQPVALPGACAAMLSNLDLYVSDELDGVDVRSRHPDLWAHLQNCSECRAEYLDLRDLLSAELRGEIPEIVAGGLELPAQRRELADAWEVAVEQVQGRREPALLFIFGPGYLWQSLRSSLHRRPASGTRAEESSLTGATPAGDILLVSYLDETPGGEISVELRARLEKSGDQALLVAQVVGEFTFTRGATDVGRTTMAGRDRAGWPGYPGTGSFGRAGPDPDCAWWLYLAPHTIAKAVPVSAGGHLRKQRPSA